MRDYDEDYTAEDLAEARREQEADLEAMRQEEEEERLRFEANDYCDNFWDECRYGGV